MHHSVRAGPKVDKKGRNAREDRHREGEGERAVVEAEDCSNCTQETARMLRGDQMANLRSEKAAKSLETRHQWMQMYQQIYVQIVFQRY
jgi:hypothetical protein